MVAMFQDKYKLMYAKGAAAYPDPDMYMAPEDKTLDYCLKWAQYIYGQYCHGGASSAPFVPSLTSTLYHPRSMRELRMYARGMQPTSKYRDQIATKKGDRPQQTESNEPIDRISNDNTRFFEKIRESAIDLLLSVVYDPGVRALDSVQRREKYERYYRDRLAASAQMKQLMAQSGVTPEGVSDVAIQGDVSDVEALHQLGGYSAAGEILLEDAIQGVLQSERYDTVLRRMLAEDIIDLGRAMAWVSVDAQRRISLRYADPELMIIPSSVYPDMRDISYAAEIRYVTLNQLRAESGGAIDTDKLQLVSNTYRGASANDLAILGREAFSPQSEQAWHGDTRVAVLSGFFIAKDCERYIAGNRANGEAIFDRVKKTTKLNDREVRKGKRIEEYHVDYIHRFNWVIGTEIIYGHKREEYVVRDGYNRPIIPLAVYMTNGGSIVNRAIPIIDDIEIAVRKKRLLFASLPPGPRISIDIKKMSPMLSLGGNSYNILQLLNIYSQRGVFLYSSVGEFDLSGQSSSQSSPITPINVDISRDVQMFLQEISTGIEALREITGISGVVDGSATAARVSTSVAAQFKEAGEGALNSCFIAQEEVFNQIQQLIGRSFQAAVRDGDIDITVAPIGTNAVNIVRLSPELFKYKFDFLPQTRPSEPEKQSLVELLASRYKEGLIDEASYFVVFDLIRRGAIKAAQFFLSFHVKKSKQEALLRQQQAIELQGQQNQAAAVAGEQAKAQTKAIEWDKRMEYLRLEYQLKSQTEVSPEKK